MDKILVVEDDKLIAELERDYLEAGNFEVEIASEGNQGFNRAMSGGFDALILDVMVPGKNGFDICREVRMKYHIPILMVTAKKEDLDKIRGLGLGADDYLVKPFSPAELVARVRSHIAIHKRLLEEKEKEQEKEEEIRIKNLRIAVGSRQVYLGRREIVLANREFELLLFLAQNPNIVFSRETLFDRIWGIDCMGSTATVTVHINRLREKLEQELESSWLIETVWGAGYRLRIR